MGDTERPKYVLLPYGAAAEFDGADGYEATWASCTDTENLFGDPPPPPRGTYELLGCAPEGDLETALTRACRRLRTPRPPRPGDPGRAG